MCYHIIIDAGMRPCTLMTANYNCKEIGTYKPNRLLSIIEVSMAPIRIKCLIAARKWALNKKQRL